MSDRKYRQRGYQDDGRDRGGKRRQRGPQQHREGPRGRGMGAPTVAVFRCGDCNKRVSVAGGVDFDQKCPHCEADLHACVNCQHFDPSARWQCRQPIEQPVAKKRSGNECELFAPRSVMEFEENASRSPEEARAAFDDLFGDL